MGLAPELVERFAAAAATIREPEQLRTYECDGLTGRRVIPALVVLPASAAEVQGIVRICNDAGIPFVARGAGTGLSGGALPVADGIVISLARMNRVLSIDIDAGEVVVEPGVTNLDVTRAVSGEGFYYAPDPSSQQVCTIGGNVAENSGGAHCLKYGFTANHVLAAEVVLPDGELVELSVWDEGPDLLGAFVGSEGTLGIATKLTLRVLATPQTVRTLLAGFAHTDAAGVAVSGTIAAGVLPAAIEMMDAITIEAAEAAVGADYPPGCGAVLIIELDGRVAQVEHDLALVEQLCQEAGAVEIRIASDPADRASVWRGRKAAFAAMGRVSPDYYVQDGVVPRTKLPEVLRRIDELSREHGLRVGNVFHAGDGNLHPLVLVRRAHRGAGGACRATRRPYSRSVCRRRWIDHRRARRRHRQGVRDAADVQRRGSRGDEATAQRVRPGRAREPGQALPHPASLRRGSGTVPRAPARTGGACRAFLSPESSSTSLAI